MHEFRKHENMIVTKMSRELQKIRHAVDSGSRASGELLDDNQR